MLAGPGALQGDRCGAARWDRVASPAQHPRPARRQRRPSATIAAIASRRADAGAGNALHAAAIRPFSACPGPALGSSAGQAITTGTDNTIVGKGAMSVATTANYNTAMGSSALVSNTTGSENTTCIGIVCPTTYVPFDAGDVTLVIVGLVASEVVSFNIPTILFFVMPLYVLK